MPCKYKIDVGWGAIDTEDAFEIRRSFVRNQEDSSTTLMIRNTSARNIGDDEWRELYTWPFGEDGTFIDFLTDQNGCLLTSSVDRDTTALLKVDLATGESQELFR